MKKFLFVLLFGLFPFIAFSEDDDFKKKRDAFIQKAFEFFPDAIDPESALSKAVFARIEYDNSIGSAAVASPDYPFMVIKEVAAAMKIAPAKELQETQERPQVAPQRTPTAEEIATAKKAEQIAAMRIKLEYLNSIVVIAENELKKNELTVKIDTARLNAEYKENPNTGLLQRRRGGTSKSAADIEKEQEKGYASDVTTSRLNPPSRESDAMRRLKAIYQREINLIRAGGDLSPNVAAEVQSIAGGPVKEYQAKMTEYSRRAAEWEKANAYNNANYNLEWQLQQIKWNLEWQRMNNFRR